MTERTIGPTVRFTLLHDLHSMSRKHRYQQSVRFAAIIVALAHALAISGSATEADDLFQDRILPVLIERCYGCHSHASGKMKGGLTLDSRSGWSDGGDSGPAIIPFKPEESELISAIRYTGLQMPPDSQLAPEIVADFVRWVEAGAPDPRENPAARNQSNADHWALKPLLRSTPEDLQNHPIDAFVQSQLARNAVASLSTNLSESDVMSQSELRLSAEADRRTLIRRLFLDLHGMPATPEQLQAFQQDDSEQAWEKLVDQALLSPRYGERWARHWLDTIHFADSHGYEHDVGRDHAWRFRDYVINALNSDIAWPRFIREQLAADVFFPERTELIPALGFLGAGTFDLSTYTTAPITFDYLDRDDLVTQTMAAFVSTTVNCARCHAHKFDPVTQEDYYAVQAVFAGVLKGNVAFDADPQTNRDRQRWQAVLAAAEKKDPALLLDPEHRQLTDRWLQEQGEPVAWEQLNADLFLSTDGTVLNRQPDGSLLASGARPDKDTYVVSGTTGLSQITALRLEVLAHESLPMNGPGRQDNGNLHLSEIEMQVFAPGVATPSVISFSHATADFDQSGWDCQRAIDGNPATAWGIHPAVGQSHHAVFELQSPVQLTSATRISVVLKQAHGNGHLIGAFRLSVTSDPASRARALPAVVESALATSEPERTETQQLELAAYVLKHVAQQALQQLPESSYVFAAASNVELVNGNAATQKQSLPEPKVVHLLHRGDFTKPKNEVTAGALSALTHLPSRFDLPPDSPNEGLRRAALADWLAHPDNVLTWRSIVNRVWHYHFGRGLCDTPNDFGRMGGEPSHPELLDWLAIWFRDEAQGSLKQLHRLILTSRTYRQSSATRAHMDALDGENRLLWRQNRQRLDADAFRDFTLAVAGSLDLSMGGPAVRHFSESPGRQVTPVLDYSNYDWNQAGASRRSIYRFVWRGMADPVMEALDFPDLGLLSPVRGFSASSLQALVMYNNDFVLHHSQKLAGRVQQEADEVDGQIGRAVQLLWLREPAADELSEFRSFVQEHGLSAFCRVLLNSNEFLFID